MNAAQIFAREKRQEEERGKKYVSRSIKRGFNLLNDYGVAVYVTLVGVVLPRNVSGLQMCATHRPFLSGSHICSERGMHS